MIEKIFKKYLIKIGDEIKSIIERLILILEKNKHYNSAHYEENSIPFS